MRLPLILRSEAEADAQAAYDLLEAARAGHGRQFIARLQKVFERIEAMPELHGIVWHDVRAARLKQFRYVVYYITFTDRVEVLAILHGARESSVWQSLV